MYEENPKLSNEELKREEWQAPRLIKLSVDNTAWGPSYTTFESQPYQGPVTS